MDFQSIDRKNLSTTAVTDNKIYRTRELMKVLRCPLKRLTCIVLQRPTPVKSFFKKIPRGLSRGPADISDYTVEIYQTVICMVIASLDNFAFSVQIFYTYFNKII